MIRNDTGFRKFDPPLLTKSPIPYDTELARLVQRGRPMASALALLAERDVALRKLMFNVLTEAGYDVRSSSNEHELKALLQSTPVSTADCTLMVLHAALATDCAADIYTVTRDRQSSRLPRVQVVFTCEFGALTLLPGIGDYHFAGLLEKPFDFDELSRLARTCRASFHEGRIKQV